jgi:hypothetical protein
LDCADLIARIFPQSIADVAAGWATKARRHEGTQSGCPCEPSCLGVFVATLSKEITSFIESTLNLFNPTVLTIPDHSSKNASLTNLRHLIFDTY